jgi:hypothetical protein
MKAIQAVVALCISVVPVAHTRQAPPSDLAQASRARSVAIDKVDAPAWEKLTAAEFTTVDETGHFMARAERLAEFKKQKPNPTPTTCPSKFTMFANGTAAVERCMSDGVWWTEVWTKTAGGWQVIAVQGTTARK